MSFNLLFIVLLLFIVIVFCIYYSHHLHRRVFERYENVYTRTSNFGYIDDLSYNEKTYNNTIPTTICGDLLTDISDVSGIIIPTNPEDIYILPRTTDPTYTGYIPSYDASNISVDYHDNPDTFKETGLPFGTTFVLDKNGEMSIVEMPTITQNVLYYELSNNSFERKNFVPTYEQSLLLSRTNSLPSSNYLFERASNYNGEFVSYSTNGSNYSFVVPCKFTKK